MPNQLRWISLSAIIILLDQFTKWLAATYLILHQPLVINRFFNLTLDYNHGAAFSFLSGEGGWQRWLFASISIIVSGMIIWLLRKMPRHLNLQAASLAFILGGAIGNLIDRVYPGVVTDFISWHVGQYYWPTFNVADSAVCVGAVLFMLSVSKKERT